MRVLAYDSKAGGVSEEGDVLFMKSMEDVLSKSNVVTLHVPLDETTRGFFSETHFRRMPAGSIFVNTARGELIDEDALLRCLKDGHVAAAALDVLVDDSSWGLHVQKGQPLVRYAQQNPNLIITPHISGYTVESVEKTRLFVTKKFVRLLTGKENSDI
jgi:D-3-phosphoglycerate dehydrogenase